MSTSSDGAMKPRSGSGRFAKGSSAAVSHDDAETPPPEKTENGSTPAGTSLTPADPRQGRRAEPSDPRFHIFVIDSRWNSAASRVLQANLALISDLNRDDPVYFLDRDTSVNLLSEFAWQIGRDPIICVHDLRPVHRRRVKHVHGFRIHLGLLRTEIQALAALQRFARFIKESRALVDVEREVRKTLILQGAAGAIEIMRARPTTPVTDEVLGIA